MGFYIEMISVGEGDSFLITLDNEGKEFHILIDGSNGERADRIVNHAKKYASGFIHFLVGTHLDDDHIKGLIPVIENLGVGVLFINAPENFKKWFDIRDYLKTFAKVTPIQKMVENIETANELLEIAKKKEISIYPAVQGGVVLG